MAIRTGVLPSEFVSFVSSPATEPFWAAAAEHRLVLPRCTNCSSFRFPPAAFCWVCRHQDVEWTSHDGNGELYSFTVMRHAVIPQVADALPIVIGVVELPNTNGCRIIGDILDCPPEVVEIGMPVAIEWYDVEEGAVPCFRPRA